jgi:hypothetical protein
MHGKACGWWIRLAVGGLWTLALEIAFAPAPARGAGCGDGLMPLHAGPDAPRTWAFPGLAGAGQSHRPRPVAPPCSGPSCSRLPLVPPAAPASPPIRWADDLGAFALPLLLASPQPLGPLTDDPPSRPVRRASDVYHPPR